jgi:hypothetical protein
VVPFDICELRLVAGLFDIALPPDMLTGMNTTLVTALVALVPVCALFSGSAIIFLRERAFSTLLQLLGATCLVMVVVVHVCEALAIFPAMHWGEPHSVGHYLDFASAILGVTLFPLGYLLHALSKRSP